MDAPENQPVDTRGYFYYADSGRKMRAKGFMYLIAANFVFSIFWRNAVATWSNRRKANDHWVVPGIKETLAKMQE